MHLKGFVCTTIGNDTMKISAIKEFYAADLQPGFTRIIVQTVLKFLSNPQNQYARSEVKKLQTPLFQILYFLGQQFNMMKGWIIFHVCLKNNF